ncbi:Protein of unknown function [Bacillus cytotoxicus]|nr:Protein of unknown function [Bacillus cytotoxicus]
MVRNYEEMKDDCNLYMDHSDSFTEFYMA